MNKTALLTAGLLASFAGPALSEVRELTLDQLSRITAGTGGEDQGDRLRSAIGGILVASDSSMTLDETSSISLDSGAQQDARGVNIVNATDTLIAQGVNVWDGQLTSGDSAVDVLVEQSNLVTQSEAMRAASVAGYSRDANSVESTTLSTTTSNLDTIDLVSDVSVDTSHQVLGQSVNVGLGLGVAGRVGIELGEAEIGFGLEAESTITTDVGVAGEINLPRPFGTMQADGELHSVISNSGSATIEVQTPAVSIDAIGSVCYTKLGLCSAVADDNSTYQTDSTLDETYTLDISGAFSLDEAGAEYIVIDESSLDLVTGHSLTLAADAQANLAAINAVNAVGSMVSNGVNVARVQLDGGTSMPGGLVQSNVVWQGR